MGSNHVPAAENPDYLSKQLITYLGSKRALLDFIGGGLELVRRRLGKRRLTIFDVFSGSGIAARYFKRWSEKLVVNDLEKYSELANRCYLANRGSLPLDALRETHARLLSELNEGGLRGGLIAELYAPGDDRDIRPGERVFYTARNARYIDSARRLIERLPGEQRPFFLAPLLSEASIHANTSGVFKGFYKDSASGLGKFGGNNADALSRIKGEVGLPFPIFSDFECELDLHRGDSNVIAECVDEVDLAYLDPPYNQHPYGSNYFMLNLLVDYVRPGSISPVSGIPADWTRSDYNRRGRALAALGELVEKLKAKFLLISFNSEGFIGLDEMVSLLERVGKTTVLETKYNAFRGSRNLGNRDIHVKEYLYLVEKS